jgi:hypothetical protein
LPEPRLPSIVESAVSGQPLSGASDNPAGSSGRMQPTVPSHFRKDFGPPFPRDREAPPILPIIVYDAKKIPLVQ